MGKKKDRVGKIPKRVGGIKLPKDLRHRGEALIGAATSPAGRKAIARGLTIVATFANVAVSKGREAAAAKVEPAAAKVEPGVAPGVVPPPAQPIVDPQKLAEALSTVADVVLGRLFGGKKG